jgi:hypothetical protein
MNQLLKPLVLAILLGLGTWTPPERKLIAFRVERHFDKRTRVENCRIEFRIDSPYLWIDAKPYRYLRRFYLSATDTLYQLKSATSDTLDLSLMVHNRDVKAPHYTITASWIDSSNVYDAYPDSLVYYEK